MYVSCGQHSTWRTPAPWETGIIRKNRVMDTYTSVGYAREGMRDILRVVEWRPRCDGARGATTDHHNHMGTVVIYLPRVQREESLVGLCGYGRWSGGRGMASGLEDEDYYEPKDEEQEKEDALPPASILLVPVERRNQKEKEGEMIKLQSLSDATREGTNRVAISSSFTDSFMCTAVCSILYSTLSRSVP